MKQNFKSIKNKAAGMMAAALMVAGGALAQPNSAAQDKKDKDDNTQTIETTSRFKNGTEVTAHYEIVPDKEDIARKVRQTGMSQDQVIQNFTAVATAHFDRARDQVVGQYRTTDLTTHMYEHNNSTACEGTACDAEAYEPSLLKALWEAKDTIEAKTGIDFTIQENAAQWRDRDGWTRWEFMN